MIYPKVKNKNVKFLTFMHLSKWYVYPLRVKYLMNNKLLLVGNHVWGKPCIDNCVSLENINSNQIPSTICLSFHRNKSFIDYFSSLNLLYIYIIYIDIFLDLQILETINSRHNSALSCICVTCLSLKVFVFTKCLAWCNQWRRKGGSRKVHFAPSL